MRWETWVEDSWVILDKREVGHNTLDTQQQARREQMNFNQLLNKS